MKVQSNGTIHQITFLPRMFPVNCYLVEEEHACTLIDCALPYSTDSILKTAESIGKPITRILLTHADDDHVGALDSLKKRLPEAEVWMSNIEAQWIGKKPAETGYPVQKKPAKFQTQADYWFAEQDPIGSLQVIETPGHTPGHVSFYQPSSGMLICGDAFQTRAGMAVAGDLRWLFPFPAIFTHDKRQALQSCKKIAQLRSSLLAPGHGRMIENPKDLMESVIDRAQRKWRVDPV